jgi:hypothetical protein
MAGPELLRKRLGDPQRARSIGDRYGDSSGVHSPLISGRLGFFECGSDRSLNDAGEHARSVDPDLETLVEVDEWVTEKKGQLAGPAARHLDPGGSYRSGADHTLASV